VARSSRVPDGRPFFNGRGASRRPQKQRRTQDRRTRELKSDVLPSPVGTRTFSDSLVCWSPLSVALDSSRSGFARSPLRRRPSSRKRAASAPGVRRVDKYLCRLVRFSEALAVRAPGALPRSHQRHLVPCHDPINDISCLATIPSTTSRALPRPPAGLGLLAQGAVARPRPAATSLDRFACTTAKLEMRRPCSWPRRVASGRTTLGAVTQSNSHLRQSSSGPIE
jgi:hypothetical protein